MQFFVVDPSLLSQIAWHSMKQITSGVTSLTARPAQQFSTTEVATKFGGGAPSNQDRGEALSKIRRRGSNWGMGLLVIRWKKEGQLWNEKTAMAWQHWEKQFRQTGVEVRMKMRVGLFQGRCGVASENWNYLVPDLSTKEQNNQINTQ